MKKQNKRCTALIAAAAISIAAIAAAGQTLAASSGDINADGTANVLDAKALAAYLTGDGTLNDPAAADYNSDGVINAVDLTLLKRGLITGSTQPENPPAAGDYYVSAITYAASSVTLYNDAGEIVDPAQAENVTVENGTYVTITKPTTDGTVNHDISVDGECANGQLKVSADKTAYPDAEVVINLRGLTLSNSSDSPVYVESCGGECIISAKKDTVNTISDGTSYTNADGSAGAIYSCDDLKFKGKGTLNVSGNCADGIVSKDDLKLWNGTVTVNAVDDGIRGKDSVRIGDPDDTDYSALNVTVTSQNGDGIKSTNDSDTSKGFVRISGGTVNITAKGGDGIQAEQAVEINGGDLTVYTYQGSAYGYGNSGDGNSKKNYDGSYKGIKAVGLYDEAGTTYQSMGNITVTGGNITVDSTDDGIHCGGDMTLTGGVFHVKSADDGFHSDNKLTIGTENSGKYDDVQIYVSYCYEGIEGVYIYQNSGTVYIISGDDGYNAAGGADGSGSTNDPWSQGGWGGPGGPGGMSSTFGELNLRGGLVVVNSASGDHDGIDSNGNVNITGGYYFCNGQEPLDCGDGGYSITQTGGTYVSLSRGGNTNLSTAYTFKDASGNVVGTVYSASGSPSVSSKDNSSAYSGASVSGGTAIASGKVILGGSASGGTQLSAGGTNPGGRQ
ncbi:MAG: carbohydrate-binding domain-containing protein [Oscillospiraceae bacterium]|nr:carbohydrate-binding domain-containing protein [Oscillospiraceae bacterium]